MAYRTPVKCILTPEQLAAFQSSKIHEEIVAYLQTLNNAVLGVKLTDQCAQSPAVESLLRVLDRVEQIAKDTPPVENAGSRFGNPAFRTFYDSVAENAASLHEAIPGLPAEAIPEVSTYLKESWGSRMRIDYGSGMELNFLCWILCLERLGVINAEDHVAIIIRVFWRYITVMRVLQSSYWLEPAGSHGVWGLDDYHFLPFLFGSAQLRGHKYIRPKSIHDAEVVEEYAKHYMYFACIQFINSVKTASLRWHSPMLDDISAVKTWDKVNEGMLKMYKAEVLGKLPVAQHFYFGTLIPPPPTVGFPDPAHTHDANDPHAGHAHPPGGQAATGWGDCCGIPVPSVFGAAQAEKGGAVRGVPLAGPGIRPVPFD